MAHDSGRMDESEIKALLAEEIRSAVTASQTDLAGRRAKALEYSRGEMNDTPSLAGRAPTVESAAAAAVPGRASVSMVIRTNSASLFSGNPGSSRAPRSASRRSGSPR